MFLGTKELSSKEEVYNESSFISSIKSAISNVTSGKKIKELNRKINPFHNNTYADIINDIKDALAEVKTSNDCLRVYATVRKELQSATNIQSILKDKISKTSLNSDYKQLLVIVEGFISKLKKYEKECNALLIKLEKAEDMKK